jgi:type II secretory pathway component PulJ
MTKYRKSSRGYSLVELLIATILFTIVAGSLFSLLMSAQMRYWGDSSVTTAFQQANVAIDQITRDVHSAGYPPPNAFAGSLNVMVNSPQSVALPFSWSPGYTNQPPTPCTVNVDCGAVPGDNDLIVEADMRNGNGVQWIRYSLQGTTLKRAVVKKSSFADPIASTDGQLEPYLENVQNGSLAIFSYGFNAGTPLWPSNIREVNILLIVQSAQRDPQTGQFRTITLTGQAVRFNPSQ